MIDFKIRYAKEDEAGLVLDFIKMLAEYEKMSDEVVADEKMIHDSIFVNKDAEVIFACEDEVPIGFALFFHNFSTFVGKKGLYLEDLFVIPEKRGLGYGKSLLMRLAEIANERNCDRFEWVCLNWNTPSINFYKSLGAVPMNEWTTFRLSGDTLKKYSKK
ncbi:MAG: GNAT family N-acetyltransferase [Bacteroidales bacterium]|nr:GNAT family N-acetyltransferase [Bacteroidales bacterium]MBR5781318.1 GNAT family N-acetyltransferase [Bacteroidales bacterium]